MPERQPRRGAQTTSTRQAARAGYVVALAINAAMLWAINVWPGWWSVPFLTGETTAVLGPINAVLAAAIIVYLIFLVVLSPAVKALGDLVVLAVGLPAMIGVWQVFPFDFGDGWAGWPVAVRVMLVLGIAGQIIGIIVGLVGLVRALAGSGTSRRRASRPM